MRFVRQQYKLPTPPQNPDTTERQESDLLTSLQIRHDPSMLILGGSFCIYRTDELPTYDSVQHIIDQGIHRYAATITIAERINIAIIGNDAIAC